MLNPLQEIKTLANSSNETRTKTHLVNDGSGNPTEVYLASRSAKHNDVCQRTLLVNDGSGSPTEIVNTLGLWDSAWDTLDWTNPVYEDGTPEIQNVVVDGFDLRLRLDKAPSSVYSVLMEGKTNRIPRPKDMLAGNGYNGATALDARTITVAGSGVDVVENYAGILTANTAYTLFLMTSDDSDVHNIEYIPSKVYIKTLSA